MFHSEFFAAILKHSGHSSFRLTRTWRHSVLLLLLASFALTLSAAVLTPATVTCATSRYGPEGQQFAASSKPRVLLETELGEIELELDATEAPITTRNFLRYVDEGFYNGGLFHRTVTMQNQPDNQIKIEVIQAAAAPERESEVFPPIMLERTSKTGLRHRDGTVSMARMGPDSAEHEFFICIGDQPELDFGGRRNPDGQGFAAFGQVIRGMEVVHRIQLSPADGQTLHPPIRIRRAVRSEGAAEE